MTNEITIKPTVQQTKTVSVKDDKAAKFFWADYLSHSFNDREKPAYPRTKKSKK